MENQQHLIILVSECKSGFCAWSGILKLILRESSQFEHFSFLLIGSLLKLSLGKDFKMDDYRALLFNVSQNVSQISVLLKSDHNAFSRSHNNISTQSNIQLMTVYWMKYGSCTVGSVHGTNNEKRLAARL